MSKWLLTDFLPPTDHLNCRSCRNGPPGRKGFTVYTFEPMVFVYNSKIIRDEEMPRTRLGLARFLENNRDRLKGKVATYDPPRVGLGFLAVSQDAKISDNLWVLVRVFGAVGTNFYVSTGTILEKISAGEHAIAYNIVGPYAYLRAARDPNVKVVFPEDYTLTYRDPLCIGYRKSSASQCCTGFSGLSPVKTRSGCGGQQGASVCDPSGY